MKLDVSRLRFKTLEIKTTMKPDFEPVINFPLFDDSHSERKKQYTISFTEKERNEYQAKFESPDFSQLLCSFFNEFSVYEKNFTNSSINLATDKTLNKCGEVLNTYVAEKKNNEGTIKNILDFLEGSLLKVTHPALINGSADLVAFIDGAK